MMRFIDEKVFLEVFDSFSDNVLIVFSTDFYLFLTKPDESCLTYAMRRFGVALISETLMNGGGVFVVDDDPTLLSAMGYILRRAGLSTRTFAHADALQRQLSDSAPSCILLDVLMPVRSGLDILSDLRSRGYSRPVVMMSGAGDIPMAVEAMQRGAANFIKKPFSSEELVGMVTGSVKIWQERQMQPATPCRTDFPGHALLTRREREILQRIAAGATAKEAALVLDISPRTVEFYRARIFQKLGAKNSADLVRIVMRAPN